MRGRIFFTPFVYEDVGKLIEQSDPAYFLFSSDYPHIEGGRDPLGRFERVLSGFDESTKARFYSQNFDQMLGN